MNPTNGGTCFSNGPLPQDWTPGQRKVAGHLVGDAIKQTAATGRPCVSFLMVGRQTIRVRVDDVTDRQKYNAAVKEVLEEIKRQTATRAPAGRAAGRRRRKPARR